MSMWFKRENKSGVAVKPSENGIAGKIRRRKVIVDKSTRESSDSDKRRHSDIIDIKASLERRESDESLYESADGQSDNVSASEDVLPRSGRLLASKESIRNAIAEEEAEIKTKKGHRKTLSLSNPLEIVKNFGEEWLDGNRKDHDKNSDKKKSKESLWSEEDRDSIHGSNPRLNEKKSNKNEKKTLMEPPKCTKRVSSVSALNFLRRKRKTIEPVAEREDRITREVIMATEVFLASEVRYACECGAKIVVPSFDDDENDDGVGSGEDLDAEDEGSEETSPTIPVSTPSRRRVSRTISRSKSKSRGKSQTVRVNTLRKSQSGTLKRAKKKKGKVVTVRSKNASVTDTPVPKKKLSETRASNYWPFSGSSKESRRDGGADSTASAQDAADAVHDHTPDKEDTKDRCQPVAGKPVNRAESCREASAASRRGKQRNASDPNRLTAKTHDSEAAAGGAPSASSSGSSLSTFSDSAEKPDAHGSQSEFSEEEDPPAEAWSASVPQELVDSLDARLRKRQELIHELIASESSHVRWLKVLHTVFLRPLERQEAGALLAPEEVRALFPNLPAVRERHGRLYADLKALRGGESSLVKIGPLAEAVLNTLGDPSYSKVLSRFCCGQRMALDALRERRRKNKELHTYLCTKEQHQLCGRLQLRDLMAIVWQRLTKYQLLLEGVLRTVHDSDIDSSDSDAERSEDVALLRRALDTAKDVLHRVDTAIRLAENQHRLKTIQSKLEVRGGSSEVEELRKLDLTQHQLIFEAELSIRSSDNKKTTLLGVMTPECLVLLHREGDKYILKQMSQLTPIIKWSTVLFRPNAAVKNTFFLMNINGVQMYQLSANTLTEYNAWTKYISEMPLAEGRAVRASSVLHNRERDDSSGGVSRNASDASRTSASSCALEPTESQEAPEPPPDAERPASPEPEPAAEKPEPERTPPPERARPTLTTSGRITTHEFDPPPLAAATCALGGARADVATRVVSAAERLRRIDEGIARAVRAKCALVGEMLGAPAEALASPAEGGGGEDVRALLLAAQAQVNQITEAIVSALNVTEADTIAARHYAPWRNSGLCDTCGERRRRRAHTNTSEEGESVAETSERPTPSASVDKEASFDMLSDLNSSGEGRVLLEEIGESSTDPVSPLIGGAAEACLARRVVPMASALQSLLARLSIAAPRMEQDNKRLREELAAARDRCDFNRAPAPLAEEPNTRESQPVQDTLPDETSGG